MTLTLEAEMVPQADPQLTPERKQKSPIGAGPTLHVEVAGGAESSGDYWRVYPNKDGGHELAVWVARGVRRKIRVPRKYTTIEARAGFSRGAAAEMKRKHKEDTKHAIAAPQTAKVTFSEFGLLWTSGDLAKRHPDHVKTKKTSDGDVQKLKVMGLIIGDVPLEAITLEHAEKVMAALDPKRVRTPATRRQYAQVMHRLLALAVYPARLIKSNPLPKGFLPKPGPDKAKSYVYPTEDAQLLACAETVVPLQRRLLYGFLAREGMREGEALGLRWSDVNLTDGVVTLDENKTDDPRAWALASGTVRALVAWKKMVDPEELATDTRVFQDAKGIDVIADGLVDLFRNDLKAAKVLRPELFKASKTRLQIRVHDLRATFVTLALANGKTEAWVTDRTGHKSSQMVNKYRRVARLVAELGQGELLPLDVAIPELAPKAKPAPVPPAPKPAQVARVEIPQQVSRGRLLARKRARKVSRRVSRHPPRVVGRAGLEPATYGLKVRSSTN